MKIGIPRPADLRFFGDRAAEAAFAASLEQMAKLGAHTVEIDMRPFYQTADLLYEAAWVAERHAALRNFMRDHADDMFPVTRRIVEGGARFSAADLFDTIYKLTALRKATAPIWREIDALVVPTTPHAPTLADVAADPIRANSELGTYTNFVNLLDLAAIAVPGPFRPDGRAAGITLIGPCGTDALLASLARQFHAASARTIGATDHPLPPLSPPAATTPDGLVELVVVGAHMSGLHLNGELKAEGAIFMREAKTAPIYRLYALPGGPPHRPGLVRVACGGASFAVEVWALPPAGLGRLMTNVPSPLSIGTLQLADSTRIKGFLCESAASADAEDISTYGGWRAYLAARQSKV